MNGEKNEATQKLTLTNSVEILSGNVMEINRNYISWAKQNENNHQQSGKEKNNKNTRAGTEYANKTKEKLENALQMKNQTTKSPKIDWSYFV